MRDKLKAHYGKRLFFKAVVCRFGVKYEKNWQATDTILLTSICYEGDIVADHVWITADKWSKHIRVGDIIIFQARVIRYNKRKNSSNKDEFETDFRLESPNSVLRLDS